MKKSHYFIVFFVSMAINLAADITQGLNYIGLECYLEPLSPNDDTKCQEEEGGNFRTTPRLSEAEGTSTNWSGYAAATNLTNPTAGSVTNVSGYWTVPTLAPTPDTSYCSFWVGIDGYKNGTVEQIGTEHIWFNGQQSNVAWFEMYPQPPYGISGFPVEPGDLIQAEVQYLGNTQFRLSLVNHSRSVYTVIPYSYTRTALAQRSSAEWIIEAPSTISGPLPLADFQIGHFMNCITTIRGVTAGIQSPFWVADPITMVTPTGQVKSLPSGLSQHAESFYCIWEHE